MLTKEITPCFVELPNRGLIKVGGEDAFKFLQNIVTQDMNKMGHSCLLTPQGKFLHDFYVSKEDDMYLLDCEGGERTKDLLKRLTVYRLRSKVTLEGIEQNIVYGILKDNGSIGTRSFAKPDLPRESFDLWDKLRISLSIADGSRDAEIEKSTLAELNMEDAIDYTKGCYIGQELTARIHHRGLSKKHLFPVKFEELTPVRGVPLAYQGKNIGEMRSSNQNIGLALLKDDNLPSPKDGFYMLDIGTE